MRVPHCARKCQVGAAPMRTTLLIAMLLMGAVVVSAQEAPDGTPFEHKILGADQPDQVRIRYCGVPLQVKLANVSFKGEQNQVDALRYLRDTLKPGKTVRIELEPELNGDEALAPQAQVFSGTTHINLEMVKRGLAISDARSKKYASAYQAAQQDASTKKLGLWASSGPATVAAVTHPKTATPATPSTPIAETVPIPVETKPVAAAIPPPVIDLAPKDYSGPVVADLNGKEYHFPMSRYAQSIRPGARIEYKSPAEAERAGKSPSPFSFPERASAVAAKAQQSKGGGSPEQVLGDAKKAYTEALTYMQEARKLSRNDTPNANKNWKLAAKLISEHLDRVTPIADANPSDRDLQKLTEEMSMSLYSCNKYQSL